MNFVCTYLLSEILYTYIVLGIDTVSMHVIIRLGTNRSTCTCTWEDAHTPHTLNDSPQKVQGIDFNQLLPMHSVCVMCN